MQYTLWTSVALIAAQCAVGLLSHNANFVAPIFMVANFVVVELCPEKLGPIIVSSIAATISTFMFLGSSAGIMVGVTAILFVGVKIYEMLYVDNRRPVIDRDVIISDGDEVRTLKTLGKHITYRIKDQDHIVQVGRWKKINNNYEMRQFLWDYVKHMFPTKELWLNPPPQGIADPIRNASKSARLKFVIIDTSLETDENPGVVKIVNVLGSEFSKIVFVETAGDGLWRDLLPFPYSYKRINQKITNSTIHLYGGFTLGHIPNRIVNVNPDVVNAPVEIGDTLVDAVDPPVDVVDLPVVAVDTDAVPTAGPTLISRSGLYIPPTFTAHPHID